MPSAEHDVANLGWAAITVRVAWTLRLVGVRLTRDRLRDVREHVLWHLPPDMSVRLAEDLAERLVRQWVARVEGKTWRSRFPEDDDHPLPQRWRDVLFAGQPSVARMVLWRHYADGVPLHRLLDRIEGGDRLGLEASREGLREAVREVARAEGRPVDGWSDDRLDDLIHRLAQGGMQPAPSLLDVVDGQRPEAVRACVRCGRAWKLVTEDHLVRADLVAPTHRARPSGVMQVVVLQLRPEIRHRRPRLRHVFPASFPLREDLLMVHAPDPGQVFDTLADRARTSWPDQDQVRGASLTLEGRWSASGPLGPGERQIEGALRHVRWGTIDPLGDLPEPLAPGPSVAPWWLGVALLAMLVVGVAQWAMEGDPATHHRYPLQVEAVRARQGWWLDFDVDELARVVVVRQDEEGPDIVLGGRSAVEKAQVATGDGRYRLHVLGERALIASVGRPLGELPGVVDGSRGDPRPLEVVAEVLRSMDGDADVRLIGAKPAP